MPAVIAENDVSIWDDETGAVYHYPRRYSAILKPGVQVVYYKGKLTDKSFADQRLSAQPHYFGIARIGKVYPNVINLSCSPAQGKPPEAASRHGRRAMTRPLPLNQAV
ncbi:hypothetical protein PALA21_04792 [Pseudomonas aeruginosa]|nr:hypothetical protein [Pseudomonas aeruginosa]